MHVSEKVKEYLIKKLIDCEQKLNKLRQKRKMIKTLYVVTVLLSIITSSVIALISTLTVPVMVISVLAAFSAILTAISVRFNFHDKKSEIKGLINKFNKIKGKLDYLIAFNGDLTQAEYDDILKNF
jgi:hypothetical protein